eukprot:CCRYP_014671-RA/>CCRYP_014671-RA protein AED:0.38 eAED:0.38 QI:258/1/1/1/1/1/2/192/321
MMVLTRRTLLLPIILAPMMSVSAESPSSSLPYSLRRSLVRTSTGNVYDQYIQNSEGRNEKYATAFFGFIAAVGTLAGFLYLVDRDLFNCKCGPCKCHISLITIRNLDDGNDIIEDQYVTPETAQRHLTSNTTSQTVEPCSPWPQWPRFSWTKPRIDRDEKDEIDDAYITPETRQYLAERREEQSKPWKFARKLFPFLWKTKKYDNVDKYRTQKIDPTDFDEVIDDDDDETIVSVLSHHVEEVRLRLFWKPTRDYDENDKYAVAVKKSDSEEGRDKGDPTSPYLHAKKTPALPWEEEEGDRDEVKTKTSSFESADSTVVPYK